MKKTVVLSVLIFCFFGLLDAQTRISDEKMEVRGDSVIVSFSVDATEKDAEEKLCKYRKIIGEFLLAQAVMNPGLQPESAQAITFDPMIRAEVMHYSLRGY